MTSLLARIALLVLRAQGKADYASRANLEAAIARRRKTDRHAPSRAWRQRHRVRIDDVHGHPCYTISPKSPPSGASPNVLFLHGGCFVFELTTYHWEFIAAVIERTGARVTVPIYPLAPEHDHREGLAMLRPLAESLNEAGDLVVIGDSAGGNLALVIAQHLTARHRPPRRTILVSPWVDLSLEDPRIADLDRLDPMLSRAGLVAAGAMWANGWDPKDPALSPIHGEMHLPTPILMFVGTREVLLPDCRTLRDRLARAGTRVDYIEVENLFHDFPLVVKLREARAAIDRIAHALA